MCGMHRFIVCAFMCRKLLKHEEKDKLILMRNNRRLWRAYPSELLAAVWEFMKIQFSLEFNLQIFTLNTRNYMSREMRENWNNFPRRFRGAKLFFLENFKALKIIWLIIFKFILTFSKNQFLNVNNSHFCNCIIKL